MCCQIWLIFFFCLGTNNDYMKPQEETYSSIAQVNVLSTLFKIFFHVHYLMQKKIIAVFRGGNLLAPHDSIRFRFSGQRFDSKPILDSKPIIDYQF